MPLDRSVVGDSTAIPGPDEIPEPIAGNFSHEQFAFDEERDRVGKGGNAVVYRATVAGEEVALKRPTLQGTMDRKIVEGLLEEARTWAAVDDHPYITSVIDWGMGPKPWIAMEYMDGGPLKEWVGELDIDQRLWTAYAVADGVAYANRKGVAHHDITPNNVLLREMPRDTWAVPKVSDWGLSRELIQHDGSISQATPEYAAPEHFDALMPQAPVDEQTDVYQLGVVCYELLTGTYPNHLRGEIKPPSDVEPSLPTGLDSVLARAIANDRSERFEHTLLFKEAIVDVVATVLRDGETGQHRQQSRSKNPGAVVDDTKTSGVTSNGTEEWHSFQGDLAGTGHRPDATPPSEATHINVGWSFETDGPVHASPALVGETLYVGSNDRNVYAFDAATGDPAWVVETDGDVYSSPAVVDGTVYVGSRDRHLYAIDTTTGRVEWKFQTQGRVRSSPAVADGTVYVGCDDGHLYAVDDTTAQSSWVFDSRGSIHSPPSVADGTVYVGSNNYSVYAIDTTTGQADWEFKATGWVRSSPAVVDGTVYVGSGDGSLYALDVANGDCVWSFETDGWVRASPAVADGTVYAGSKDGTLYALDAATGDCQWQFETGGWIRSSPVVADGVAIVGSKDGTLYALDATTGRRQWALEMGSPIYSTPAVVDGTVYVGTDDGNVYGIGRE